MSKEILTLNSSLTGEYTLTHYTVPAGKVAKVLVHSLQNSAGTGQSFTFGNLSVTGGPLSDIAKTGNSSFTNVDSDSFLLGTVYFPRHYYLLPGQSIRSYNASLVPRTIHAIIILEDIGVQ